MTLLSTVNAELWAVQGASVNLSCYLWCRDTTGKYKFDNLVNSSIFNIFKVILKSWNENVTLLIGWDNKYHKIFIHAQCLQKMNKKLGYRVLRQILFTSSAALQQQHLARTNCVMLSWVQNQNKKRRSRPTRHKKTLGLSEVFRSCYPKRPDVTMLALGWPDSNVFFTSSMQDILGLDTQPKTDALLS